MTNSIQEAGHRTTQRSEGIKGLKWFRALMLRFFFLQQTIWVWGRGGAGRSGPPSSGYDGAVWPLLKTDFAAGGLQGCVGDTKFGSSLVEREVEELGHSGFVQKYRLTYSEGMVLSVFAWWYIYIGTKGIMYIYVLGLRDSWCRVTFYLASNWGNSQRFLQVVQLWWMTWLFCLDYSLFACACDV